MRRDDPQENRTDELTFVSDVPNVRFIRNAFDDTMTGLSPHLERMGHNYNDRRNEWAGKSSDRRKNGDDAFPWPGASDSEAHVIDDRVDSFVAMCMSALMRANIKAFPVETGDISRAKVVSNFLRWMVQSYLPNFAKEMEAGANSLFENGMVFTYCGWQKEKRTRTQEITLDQIAAVQPGLAQAIVAGEDREIVRLIRDAYPDTSEKRAKRAARDLREEGMAKIMVSTIAINRPEAINVYPDSEFFFPPYVKDPQMAPYCFRRIHLTPQELWNHVENDGWDRKYVEHIIERAQTYTSNVNFDWMTNQRGQRIRRDETASEGETRDQVEIIFCYQRLVDPDDHSQGIYVTVTDRQFSVADDGEDYAIHYLLNGYDDFPVVATRLEESSIRFYEVQAFPEKLRGQQWLVKSERDCRIDRNSLATCPPLMHPPGLPPPIYGPAVRIPRLRPNDYEFGDTPRYNPDAVEFEKQMLDLADRLLGLDADNPVATTKRQHWVNKFLMHVQKVLKLSYKNFQLWGPDEIWFQVTGVPDPQKFPKGDESERYDVTISFDVLNNEPEAQEKKLQSMVSLVQLDHNGRIDMDALLDVLASAVDPALADSVLRPAQEAQDKVTKDVTDDLVRIFAGIETPARPNAAGAAMKILEQYAAQPDIQERLTTDESFKDRLEKYQKQYQHQMDQARNAQIGRIGTQPAQVGEMNVQGMQR